MAILEISPSSTCVSLTPSSRQVVLQGTLCQRDTDQGNWDGGGGGGSQNVSKALCKECKEWGKTHMICKNCL